MSEIDTVEEWPGWPADGATRDELIASLDHRARWHEHRRQEELRDYELRIKQWRETIGERLLELVPLLEAREFEYASFTHGGWAEKMRDLHAPYRPEPIGRWSYDNDANRRAVLEALPSGPVSREVRRAIDMESKESLEDHVNSLRTVAAR